MVSPGFRISDPDLHLTGNDHIALLTFMAGQLDDLGFCAGVVLQLHVQRQGNTVTEVGSQVVANHTVAGIDALTLTLTGQVVRAQLGAAAFQQVAHVNAEAQGTAVQESNA